MEQEKIWDAIAESWSKYRKKPLLEVKKFLENKKGRILDLFSGSGRNLIKTNAEIFCVDFSKKMLDLAEKKAKKQKIKCRTVKIDSPILPFKSNFFDSAIFIAGLHCVEKAKNRKKILEELFRVMKPNSLCLLTVWSKKHKKIKKFKENYITWKINKKEYKRFYYIFKLEELEKLLKEVGFFIVELKEDKNIIALIKT